MTDLFDQLATQADAARGMLAIQTQQLRDFTRRLELILSQDHKQIQIRDTAFGTDFTQFCTQLRSHMDQLVDTWQHLRGQCRISPYKELVPNSLQAKNFSLRAKNLSRCCDDFTTAYDQFNRFYKNYTLAKLPVWMLTACCDDLNNITGKILFLSREITKRMESKGV
ncbi:MAG: hypothetical protein IKN49_01095 [Elusimicrobiaceae bacterium]|nr:hypothetical protein [Elusimicrobiaceae bacterium]